MALLNKGQHYFHIIFVQGGGFYKIINLVIASSVLTLASPDTLLKANITHFYCSNSFIPMETIHSMSLNGSRN